MCVFVCLNLYACIFYPFSQSFVFIHSELRIICVSAKPRCKFHLSCNSLTSLLPLINDSEVVETQRGVQPKYANTRYIGVFVRMNDVAKKAIAFLRCNQRITLERNKNIIISSRKHNDNQ